MTTTLHDQLRDAVRDVSVDPVALAAQARRRAAPIRRRRIAARTTLVAVAASAVVAATWTVLPGPGEVARTPVATDPTAHTTGSPATPVEREPVRITGRTTAAILLELVGRQTSTAIVGDSVRGSGGAGQRDTFGEARLVDGALVQVNLQSLADMGDAGRCASMPMLEICRETPLPRGDLLVTYTDDEADNPDDVREVAAVFSPRRDLRVVVGSTVPAGVENPLTSEQLAAVASDPVWDWRVPAEWADRGDALPSYSSTDETAR